MLASMYCGLASLDRKCLICLDNADNTNLNRIIGELARKVRSCDGWLIVTSRQGGDMMWQSMVSEQKLRLLLLGVDNAMIAFYRYKENISNDAATDVSVAV